MSRKGSHKINKPVNSTHSETGSLPATYDKLNHTYSRDVPAEPNRLKIAQSHEDECLYQSCISQEVECNRKPTVKTMENGKGIVRSNHGVTAILNPPNLNKYIDIVVTPSKTHPSYYDVNLPSTDNR